MIFLYYAVIVGLISLSGNSWAQVPDLDAYLERARTSSARMEEQGLTEPYRGIMTSEGHVEDLYRIHSTGVSTKPVRDAARAFLLSLDTSQRDQVLFAVDDIEWRKWANQHIYLRDGLSFENMSVVQREAAFELLAASLSARGLTLTRDIMRLNGTLAEMKDNNYIEYGEWKYWVSILGEPSATEPWGWQLDGHHLNINYFVLGDQVVMTPAFWGSEPVVARSGQFAGTRIMDEETTAGLALFRSLASEQQDEAVLEVSKEGNNILAQAFSDNLVLDYAGIPASHMDETQRNLLLDLVGLYVGNLQDDHAHVRMVEVENYLEQTWFAWIGGAGDDAVFYYRIHSPVILIEFDHQRPVALRHLYPDRAPNREHVHSVVRTPNGNDYGKDLLRQHYRQYAHGMPDANGVAQWHD